MQRIKSALSVLRRIGTVQVNMRIRGVICTADQKVSLFVLFNRPDTLLLQIARPLPL